MDELKFYDDDGDEVTIQSKYEVCPRCNGKGTHDPSYLAGGFTRDDVDEWAGPDSDEWMADYLHGQFDVKCTVCDGKRVVLVPDEEAADPEVFAAYERYYREIAEMNHADEMERRMGA